MTSYKSSGPWFRKCGHAFTRGEGLLPCALCVRQEDIELWGPSGDLIHSPSMLTFSSFAPFWLNPDKRHDLFINRPPDGPAVESTLRDSNEDHNVAANCAGCGVTIEVPSCEFTWGKNSFVGTTRCGVWCRNCIMDDLRTIFPSLYIKECAGCHAELQIPCAEYVYHIAVCRICMERQFEIKTDINDWLHATFCKRHG